MPTRSLSSEHSTAKTDLTQRSKILLFKSEHELSKIFGFKIPRDGVMMVATGQLQIDVIALDDKFAEYDSEYDSIKCTYKGKSGYTMDMYVKEKYGEVALELFTAITP